MNEQRNVSPVSGGKVHRADTWSAERGTAFPMCRSGGQNSRGTRYRWTTQPITCDRCAC